MLTLFSIADSLLRENSSNEIGHFLKGVVNGMANNYSNSLEAYDNALSLFPKFVFAYFNRANTRYELEEYLYSERVYTDDVTITWDKIPAPDEKDKIKEPDFAAVLMDYDRVIGWFRGYGDRSLLATERVVGVGAVLRDLGGAVGPDDRGRQGERLHGNVRPGRPWIQHFG